MSQSLISTSIPQAVVDAAQARLQEVIDSLTPYTVALSPDSRRETVKMGDKSVAYADKVAGYMGTNSEFIPRRIDKGEFDKDYLIPRQLRSLQALAHTLDEMLGDTSMAAGSDIMMACNAYYNSVADAAHSGEAGAKAIYDDLKARYPGGSRQQAVKP